jgi:hypothetical protein
VLSSSKTLDEMLDHAWTKVLNEHISTILTIKVQIRFPIASPKIQKNHLKEIMRFLGLQPEVRHETKRATISSKMKEETTTQTQLGLFTKVNTKIKSTS